MGKLHRGERTCCDRCRSHDGPLSPGADCGSYRKTGLKFGGYVGSLQPDLDGNALQDFGEVAGSVVVRQQCKVRSAGGGDFEHSAMNDLPGLFVDANLRGIAHFHVGELRLSIVRLYPFGIADERNYLRARRNQLAWPHLPLAYRAVHGSRDLGVAEVHLSDGECRLLGVEVSDKLEFL